MRSPVILQDTSDFLPAAYDAIDPILEPASRLIDQAETLVEQNKVG